ncbi:transmembrane protein, putative (macronuclear) [Tetrahymena thermophila SB210]|uniref:Transmembrane protein, putative n=1 Tax=Tetrahymena thermophila (strain SB210) TaxID=312017 RepID=Q22N64_TETTS|nr:transmembrane protein, putative [Tetrahymena thermophila SB210]EAR86921.2 transmembrane protein, putative [Tetrahymena thermophila SB210]|eukprot:XP_001007166.2 transmembrane protein, putative [Tetrahymena thermophila SB210]
MKQVYIFLNCLFFISLVAGSTVLEASIKSTDAQVCVNDLKSKHNLLQSLLNDLQKKNYLRVMDKINDLNSYFNTTVSKCADQFCWMDGQQRCEYTFEQSCELVNNMWYPKCKTGYKVKEQSICVQECPQNFKESGLLYCEKPESYFRGLGYPWKFGDKLGSLEGARQRCAHENPQGCEKAGAIIYPNCKENYHISGCCQCVPNCPNDMKDNGVTCMRKQYARGFGHTNGQCVADQWKEYSPLESFGGCVDQLNQLEVELNQIQEKLNLDSDKTMWDTLKQAYVIVQQSSVFSQKCTQEINALPSNSDNTDDNTSDSIGNGWTLFFEIFFKVLQWIVNLFQKNQ